MRIVIASGIFPPEVGGPALYAEGVKKALEARGIETPLVLFASVRSYPVLIRHLLYAWRLFFAALGADAIFAFDTGSAGVPSAFVGVLLRKQVVIRIGGDYVWEQYCRRTGKPVPLPHFYAKRLDLRGKEYVSYLLVRWMLRHADLAFNTRWLMEIWEHAYDIELTRAHVVENVIGERVPSTGDDGTVLLYGRSIALKNAAAFRRAFALSGIGLKLEDGTLPQEAFLQRVRGAHAVAVPSVSDVAPNNVIDAIRCGKPFLLTKYSGYAEEYGQFGVLVDPLDEEDMARGAAMLEDRAIYDDLCRKIRAFTEVRTYANVADEYLALLSRQ